MRLIDLLENYIIIKEKDRNLYYDINDNIGDYIDFIKEKLNFNLIMRDDFIKLEKIPQTPNEFMGIKDFDSKTEYIFLMLLIIFLEDKNKEEQFILSNITEYIKYNYSYIDWTKTKYRKSLVKVMKLLIDIGVIKRTDGDEDNFYSDEKNDVLYENTGLSKYIVRNFQMDIENVSSYKDLLDKSDTLQNKIYKNLILSPIMYNEDKDEYDYLKRNKNHIANNFDKYLDWDIHIHKNGALATLKNSSIKDVFPNKKGESSVVLIINNYLDNLIKDNKLKREDNDTVILKKYEFKNILKDIRKEYGHGFVKLFRECSDEVFCDKIINYMKEFFMIKETTVDIIIMPLISKVVGSYPSDYKGEKNEG